MIRIIQQFVRKNLDKQTCVQPSTQRANHLLIENPFSVFSNSDRLKDNRKLAPSREASRLWAQALDKTESSFVLDPYVERLNEVNVKKGSSAQDLPKEKNKKSVMPIKQCRT
jgi:hypothetical protein